MKTRVLVSAVLLVPLAGTIVRSVPPSRKIVLAPPDHPTAQRQRLSDKLRRFVQLFQAGDYRSAETLAEQGYREAIAAGQSQIAASFLCNVGGCRFAEHHFQGALDAYLQAQKIADASHNSTLAGKLDVNISSLYSHLGQMDAAAAANTRAMARLSGPERLAQLPKLLIQRAALEADRGSLQPALDWYRRGITAADRASDREMYAVAWNDLGYEFLEHRQYPEAERALLESYRVRKLDRLRSVESSYRNLGTLRLLRGEPAAASSLLDRAVAMSLTPGGLLPSWEIHYQRGAARLQQNLLPAALEDLRLSARLSREWRRNAFPDDATRMSAEGKIQKVHAALVDAGNRLYFETRRPELARETFESAEANRAAGLRALLAEPHDWRRNLPSEYWKTLGDLEAAEVQSLRSPENSAAVTLRMSRLRGALVQWESQAGSNTDFELDGLLERTRRALRPNAVLFAFHLAEPNSYLWAVSRSHFALYKLPGATAIGVLVAAYTKAIREGSTDALTAAEPLYSELFGQVSPEFRRQPHWLLALDSQLFELPFAALVEKNGPRPVFLAERHSLQIVSSAGLLLPAAAAGASRTGPFVGIADPLYNTADPRWTGRGSRSFLNYFAAWAGNSSSVLQLARLPGSAREISACANAWSASGPTILLEGAAASREGLHQALGHHPSVLHFAAHVVRSSLDRHSSMIALSLDAKGQHQVLSPIEISTWNLRGTLVSLSGCSSGAADALPATGLMGLTRACQAAGADAVVASHWPTSDDSGALFLSFYRHLRAAPDAGPAVALQNAQIDMLRSASWRSNPLYWSAYFITGNQQ